MNNLSRIITIPAASLREGHVLAMPVGQPDQLIMSVYFLRSEPSAVVVGTVGGQARFTREQGVRVLRASA